MLAKITENAEDILSEKECLEEGNSDAAYEKQVSEMANEADKEPDVKFHVGESAYDVVLVPVCLTLRSSTIDALEAFVRAGGKVIFTGEVPKLEEGAPSGRLAAFASFEMSQEELLTEEGIRGEIVNIPFSRTAILEALEPYRELKILDKSGKICTKLISQLRQDGDDQWLFVCYARKKPRYDCELTSWMKICKKGIWYPTEYDTMTGEIKPCEYVHENGMTYIMKTYHVHDSVLLKLMKEQEAEVQATAAERPLSNTASAVTNLNRMSYTLSEPNVAVLDRAQYRLDEEAYRPEEEVLRIGQQLCAECGYPPQGGKIAQPWTVEQKTAPHKVTLAFTFESELAVTAPLLALEHAGAAEVTLNGKLVKAAENDVVEAEAAMGWYVDKSIRTVALPEIPAGSSMLCITYPFGENTSLENAFLLGSFGVRVEGSSWVLTKQPETVAFGSLVSQGFPFYGGNISYEMELDVPEGDFAIRTSYYRGALIGVSVDGKREGSIVFSPYRFEKKGLAPGRHKVTLTLFGTRINTFGTLHNCNENETWFGPDAWRTKGDYYSEEYQLKRTGILKRPEIS